VGWDLCIRDRPFNDYGNFASGGVSFGNVNLETIRFKGPSAPVGIAFEPVSLQDLLADLDTRHVRHGVANPVHRKDDGGKDQLAWTTVQLEDLPPMALVHGFFCKYHGFDVDRARIQSREELGRAAGGPLGIEQLTELVLSVRDLSLARAAWTVLLGPPHSQDNGAWQLGGGPALRLAQSSEEKITLRVKVTSPDKARTFLNAAGTGETTLNVALPAHVQMILTP
jgi:hypothetical protein